MAQDAKLYLAANVLNESKIVTYRSLSRALKVHNHVAKKMLYEFHTKENTKKAGCVYATYLLSGAQHVSGNAQTNGAAAAAGEDTPMPSSPYMSSSMPQHDEELAPLRRVISLVREEDLESTKAKYAELYSIHVYSLSPNRIDNLQLLSESNRQVQQAALQDDSSIESAAFGVIQNPNVKKRKGGKPPVLPAIALSKPTKPPAKASTTNNVLQDPAKKPPSKETPIAEIKREDSLDKKATTSRAAPPQKPKPALKRGGSDFFKAFNTKSKAKTAEVTAEPETPVVAAATFASEDEPMKDASESEQEDDFVAAVPSKADNAQKQSRTEREETLRKMMEDDDEEGEDEVMEDVPEDEPIVEDVEIADDSGDDGGAITSAGKEIPARQQEEASEQKVTVSDGRRRGKRKVMKKRMIKDDEGYLVTKEEPAWESFSEDEVAPPPPISVKPKAAPAPVTRQNSGGSSAAATGGGVKGQKKGQVGKPGQGNIMNFFGKKG
ncbi:hypothetical protein MMC25_006806 [Agyrium rufum]|nr:hypothetical protein [Agyrium rufum]